MSDLPIQERAYILRDWILAQKKIMDDLPLASKNNINQKVSADQIEVITWYIDNDLEPKIHFNNNKTRFFACVYPDNFLKY